MELLRTIERRLCTDGAQDIELTPQQASAWHAFATSIEQISRDVASFDALAEQQIQGASLSLHEMLEIEIERLEVRLVAICRISTASTQFYEGLSSRQREQSDRFLSEVTSSWLHMPAPTTNSSPQHFG